ncbi:MAG: quinol oxidase [Thermodesulfobacteriota bacterium]
MKYHKWIRYFVVFTLLCLLAALATRVGAEGDQEKRLVASVGEDGIQRVEVYGGEYYFEPKHIVVQVNKPVELSVRKGGGFIPHNIIVEAPDAGIDFNVGMGKEFQPIRFTPTRTGRYTMYCDKRFLWFKTHQAKGMEGIIEVVE